MWGLLITGFRYGVEKRRQAIDERAALEALHSTLEVTR